VDTLSFLNNTIAHSYEKSIGQQYKIEYTKCAITDKKNILHIGCGAYPLTEIMYGQKLHASILGIDNNREVVRHAETVIQKKKLQEKVTIQYGEGTHFPVQQYDVIILSSCSTPKLEILRHVVKNAKKGTTVIVRELETSLDNILTYIHDAPNIKLVQKIRHTTTILFLPTTWYSLHLQKVK